MEVKDETAEQPVRMLLVLMLSSDEGGVGETWI